MDQENETFTTAEVAAEARQIAARRDSFIAKNTTEMEHDLASRDALYAELLYGSWAMEVAVLNLRNAITVGEAHNYVD